jgi:hypothetical protein
MKIITKLSTQSTNDNNMIKYKDNINEYTAMLKKKHGGIAIASSHTVNDAANMIEAKYKSELKGFKLRNKFTENAVKKNLSRPQNSKGDFRPIEKINAVVGVMKMKGGKDHYLLKQEEGGITKGNLKTDGKVAFPLNAARTSNSNMKPIKGALQLQKSSRPQVLRFSNGKPLGTKNDGFSGKQRWAIFYKYTGLSGKGKKIADPRYGWDAKKPFFFFGLVRGFGVFQAIGSRVKMLRRLDRVSVNIKATGKFQKSVSVIDKSMMEHLFIKNAKKISGGK